MPTMKAETTETSKTAQPPVEVEQTQAQKKLRAHEDQSLFDYVQSLTEEFPVRVTVIRKFPKAWRGHSIEGTIETFEEPIAEETIKDLYGGGTYAIRIQRPNDRGNWVYFANRTIKIAGDPIIRGMVSEDSDHGNGHRESPSVVTEAMRMAAANAERAEMRAQRMMNEAQGRGPDPIVLKTIEGMQQERRETARMMAEKDREYREMLQQAQSTRGSSDILLEKFITGENTRLDAIRMQHESELRAMRERHSIELDRVNSRADDLIKRMETTQEREIANLKFQYEGRIETLKSAHESSEKALQREIKSLERELEATKTELAEYRAKREKPITEQLAEMHAVKEAFESFGGGDKEEGSTVERIIGGVLNSSIAEGIAGRLASGAAPEGPMMPPQAQQAMVPNPADPLAHIPVGQPVQLDDGRIIVKKADGSIVQLKQKQHHTPTGEPLPKLDPVEVTVAVQFMESAYRNDTDPSQFASTARSVVPDSVLQALRSLGVDRFLEDVAKLDPQSPLRSTVAGKNWARKVAEALLSD
jgi:hypothetical protein